MLGHDSHECVDATGVRRFWKLRMEASRTRLGLLSLSQPHECIDGDDLAFLHQLAVSKPTLMFACEVERSTRVVSKSSGCKLYDGDLGDIGGQVTNACHCRRARRDTQRR
jgi:hypothetical protein